MYKIHYKVAEGAEIDHPVFGKTFNKPWIACGTSAHSSRTTVYKYEVTCIKCLAAIKREGF